MNSSQFTPTTSFVLHAIPLHHDSWQEAAQSDAAGAINDGTSPLVGEYLIVPTLSSSRHFHFFSSFLGCHHPRDLRLNRFCGDWLRNVTIHPRPPASLPILLKRIC